MKKVWAEVSSSVKLSSVILLSPWVFVPNFIAIYLIAVELLQRGLKTCLVTKINKQTQQGPQRSTPRRRDKWLAPEQLHVGVAGTGATATKMARKQESRRERRWDLFQAPAFPAIMKNNKFSLRRILSNLKMLHDTKEWFSLSGLRLTLQTRRGNLFWVICLDLIMSFIFLLWRAAGILDMNI